jgi:hypothetical protein
VQNAKQQVQKVCLKKCKYRVEEIEVIKILGLHCNVIETLLIVQSSDHMLLFMPQLTCEYFGSWAIFIYVYKVV